MESTCNGAESSHSAQMPLDACQREVEALRNALATLAVSAEQHARTREKAAQERVAELEVANEELQRHGYEVQCGYRLLEVTASSANALLTIDNVDEAVNTALQMIGEALETDRVNVIENFAHSLDASPHWRVLYEWDSPGTTSQFSNPNAAQGSYDEILWLYELLQQQRTASYLIEETPEPFRSEQAAIGVKSTHLVSIHVEGKWWGVLGLDDCREAKCRNAAELAVLQIAADCIGSAIQHERLRQATQRTQQALIEAEQARTRSAAERSQELERINAQLQQALQHEVELCYRLKASEERYRTLFELSHEGIYRFEFEQPISISLPIEEQVDLALQHYRFAEANQAFFAQMGVSNIGELIQFTLSDFHGNVEQNRQVNRAIIQNGYQIRNAETDEINALGRRKFFLNNVICDVRDSYMWGGWCTQTDITELKQSQQALLRAEQERVAELAKANHDLQQRDRQLQHSYQEVQRSYRLLSVVAQVTKDLLEAEDVDTAIPAALRVVGEAASMSRVQLLLERQDPVTDKLEHVIAYEWVATGITPQINHPTAAVMDNDDFGFIVQEMRAGRSIWRVVEDFPDPIRTIFGLLGIKSSGTVPIFIEGRYIGGVGFDDCTTPRHWSQQEIDVLAAAAESIGAALHRKQLVDRLVEEQIHAEQERATELAKANEVLQRTASQLVGQHDLNRFLERMLLEVAQEIGAVNTCIFLYDRPSHTLRMHNAVQDEQVVNIETDPRFEIWRLPVSADHNDGWSLIQLNRYVWHALEDNTVHGDDIWDFSEAWHRMMRHRFVMAVLLQVGDEPLGFMGICFREHVYLSSERLELVRSLANQAALAVQLTQLAEEAKQAGALEERNRMAREMHDTIAQALTGIIIQLEATKGIVSTQPDAAHEHLSRASILAREGLAEARRSVRALRPEALESRDLPTALTHLVQQMTKGTDLKATVDVTGIPRPLSSEVEVNLLRIGQEALTNVLKHAHAQTVSLTLHFAPQAVQLKIVDDGQGFDPRPLPVDRGFGLIGMQERSQRLGSTFTLFSRVGAGTTITVTVPTQ